MEKTTVKFGKEKCVVETGQQRSVFHSLGSAAEEIGKLQQQIERLHQKLDVLSAELLKARDTT